MKRYTTFIRDVTTWLMHDHANKVKRLSRLGVFISGYLKQR